MTRDVAAVERTRVDVADAFVIGEKVDAIADPHRPSGVTVGKFEFFEVAAMRCIGPDLARRSAAIALPARGIERVATEHERTFRSDRKRARMSELQFARFAAVTRNRKRPRLTFEPGARVGNEVNLRAVRAPADNLREGRTQERQALRFAAARRHDVDFGIAVVVRDERDRSSRRARAAASYTCRSSPSAGSRCRLRRQRSTDRPRIRIRCDRPQSSGIGNSLDSWFAGSWRTREARSCGRLLLCGTK